MRCCCCNRLLSDYESTLKSTATGEYMDTCSKCLDGLDIEVSGNDDLKDQSADDFIVEDDYMNTSENEN